MTTEEVRIGVCVTLKSGSPKMIICGGPSKGSGWKNEPADVVDTVWFDGGQMREGKFLIALLNVAPD